MISLIYGAKGTGKTRRIIDAANLAGEKASGKVVFIADNTNSLAVNPNVRFVNLAEYKVKSEDEFIGFLKGMLATDFDIQQVFVDGIGRLLQLPVAELKPIFDTMSAVSDSVDFVVTVSTDTLPEFLKSFVVKG